MSRQKKYSILTLAVVFMAALVAAFTLLFGATVADARNITLTGSNYFYTANNAEIDEYEDEDAETYYTMFVFNEEDSAVTYRKNLAYHWYASVKDEDGEATAEVEEGYLNTEIGFTTTDEGTLPFATFTIKFQSQQYSETKDGVTSNYIVFIANEDGDGVYVVIGDEDVVGYTYEDISSEIGNYNLLKGFDQITISFSDYASGEYTITVTDSTGASQTGAFTNVGGSYAQYVSSSSSTSVIPLTYSATFAEDNDPDSTENSYAVGMILYSFNGQSFELSGSGGYVTDNVAPVLCLNEVVTTLRYGSTIDLDYAVIDMLATSPRSTLYYYVLTTAQVTEGASDSSYNYEYDTTAEDGDEKFIETSSSSDAVVIRESGAYTGSYYDNDGNEVSDALAYVKVYFYIKDSTASSGTGDWVSLDWYVSENSLAYINGASFIKAVSDEEGATYSYNNTTVTNETEYKALIEDITEKYQGYVDSALSAQEASAGDGNYFYLPSFEEFVSDNYTDYTSLTFSIYYLVNSSSGSSSSLAYNELAIELDEEGSYKFAIYVTDAEGNLMWYYDEDGAPVKISADDIADLLEYPSNSDLYGIVPVFSFKVSYVGLSVETPGAQDIAYVDSDYTASSFDITGLSSNYSATYTLYVFDLAAYVEDCGTITYAQFISKVKDLFDDAETRVAYFSSIKALDDMVETDADYDTYADYEWDPDSLSFVAQDENTFYVIVLTVSDKEYATADLESFMCISVSAAAESLAGESEWLQNNIASVVLLCVAGAALIGIVLLIVIKPREKGDIDIIDQNEEKKPKKRKFGKKA